MKKDFLLNKATQSVLVSLYKLYYLLFLFCLVKDLIASVRSYLLTPRRKSCFELHSIGVNKILVYNLY